MDVATGVVVFVGVPFGVVAGDGVAFVCGAPSSFCMVKAASIEREKTPATNPAIIHRVIKLKTIQRIRIFHLILKREPGLGSCKGLHTGDNFRRLTALNILNDIE